MAKPITSTKIEPAVFHGPISLAQSEADTIGGSIDNPNVPLVQKIFAAATEALRAIAAGGKLIQATIVDRIEQATGKDFDEEDLPSLVEKAVNLRGGNLCGYWEIDPSFESAIQERSQMCGLSNAQEYVQAQMDQAIDFGWVFEDLEPQPKRILMTPEDHAQIEELLGEKFSNGTQLAEAIRRFAGSDAGVFSGV